MASILNLKAIGDFCDGDVTYNSQLQVWECDNCEFSFKPTVNKTPPPGFNNWKEFVRLIVERRFIDPIDKNRIEGIAVKLAAKWEKDNERPMGSG